MKIQIDVAVYAEGKEEPVKSWLWNGTQVPRIGEHFDGHKITGVYWTAPDMQRDGTGQPHGRDYPLVSIICEE
jgi:hypothetical protein